MKATTGSMAFWPGRVSLNDRVATCVPDLGGPDQRTDYIGAAAPGIGVGIVDVDPRLILWPLS